MNKHVIYSKCSPAAEARCTDHNAMLFDDVCPGGLPYTVRGLQEAQRRRVHAGGGGTERSSTGSAGQRGAIDGCLQPSGDRDESHWSHCGRGPVGDDCTMKCCPPPLHTTTPSPLPSAVLFSIITSWNSLWQKPLDSREYKIKWYSDHHSHYVLSQMFFEPKKRTFSLISIFVYWLLRCIFFLWNVFPLLVLTVQNLPSGSL